MLAICRVIIGVSGSPRNLPALRYAAALAHAHAATLISVLAWIPTGGELADQRCRSPYLRREGSRPPGSACTPQWTWRSAACPTILPPNRW